MKCKKNMKLKTWFISPGSLINNFFVLLELSFKMNMKQIFLTDAIRLSSIMLQSTWHFDRCCLKGLHWFSESLNIRFFGHMWSKAREVFRGVDEVVWSQRSFQLNNYIQLFINLSLVYILWHYIAMCWVMVDALRVFFI